MRTRKKTLIVEAWSEQQRSAAPTLRRSSFFRPTMVGLFGAIVLHGAIVALLLGFKSHPERIKISVINSAPLVLMNPIDEPNASAAVFVASADTTALTNVSSSSRSLARSALGLIANSVTIAPVDDDIAYQRGMLFGIYTGQITARIERTWMRPRTSVTEADNRAPSSDFVCEVKILQNSIGAVQEVDLLSCNGTIAWQQSLVKAILSASPLPAPPSPTVFANALTLTFSAHEFHAGDAEEGYALAMASR